MTDTKLQLEMFTLGPWQTNCFLLWVEGGRDCWIIDAGFEPAPMIEAIEARGLGVTRIVLTHGHADHIGGLAEMSERWPDAPIAIHPEERAFLSDPTLNLSGPFGMPFTAPPADETLEGGQRLTLGETAFEVMHTPGHSPGGVTLHQPEAGLAIVGDTLFAGGIGRYDFPTSDGPTLMRSIQDKLLTLPDGTRIYPGHGPATTIAAEKRGNPFLR